MNPSIENESTAAGDHAAATREGETADSGTTAASDIPRRKRPPIWPFVGYFLAVAGAIAVAIYALPTLSGFTVAVDATLGGSALGLASLLGVIGGLWGRCWIAGFWLAWLLASAGVMGLAVAMDYPHVTATSLAEMLLLPFAVPAGVFGAAAPYLLMRTLFGWRLARSDQPVQVKRPLGLVELMAMVTVLASLAFLMRIPPIVRQRPSPDYFMLVGMSAAALFAISLFIVLPAVRFGFRCRTRPRRWMGTGLTYFLGLMTVASALSRIGTSSWTSIDWLPVFGVPAVATLVFVVGMAILKAAGFGLMRHLPAGDPRADLAASDPALQPARLRALYVRWAAGTLAVAVTASIVLNVSVTNRLRHDEAMARLAERLRDRGGDLVVYTETRTKAEIGEHPPAEILAELSRRGDVKDLSLAGSRIETSLLRRLPEWFPELQTLDLGNTGITADSLQHLLRLRHLIGLGLAGSELTIDEINDFIRRHRGTGGTLVHLDLSDTRLSSDAIRQLDDQIRSLSLRRLGWNDSDMATIQGRKFLSLDISGNPLTGNGLAEFRIFDLTAHDVPLTDDGLRMFLQSPTGNVEKITLSKTRLTDASAPLLLGIGKLHLGEGTISEAALAANATPLQTLGLHAREFTGKCLPALGPQCQFIDLSGSGVTDQALSDLGDALRETSTSLHGLNLADTDISDHGLQGLDGINIWQLDLRRTAVTASGIRQIRSQRRSIHVDFGQFTPRQLQMLRQHHTLVVGEKPWWQ